MFVIRAIRNGPHYLARSEGRRPYRWVSGDAGLQTALRFSNEEEAGIVATGREYYGTAARVVWDPRSTGREPQRRRRGFVIRAGAFYVVMADGLYRWQRGQDAEAEAFRFSSAEAAGKMVLTGFNGTGGTTSRVIEIR
jgi:hypothetical protein